MGRVNNGKAMVGSSVARDGTLCAIAVSTEDMARPGPGSRGIAIAKRRRQTASVRIGARSTAGSIAEPPGIRIGGASEGNP